MNKVGIHVMLVRTLRLVNVQKLVFCGMGWMVASCCLGHFAYGMPKPSDMTDDALPQLETALTSAGWTMTPERSATYAAGDIYSRTTNAPVVFGAKCFEADAREGAYTSLEVVQALKAGGRVPLGMAKFEAKGMQYKQLTFAEPYVRELSDMDLMPTKSCATFLRTRRDLEDLFVIQAVLSAEVKEQLCRTLDASAGVLGFGASASLNQECVQGSEGHVAVAYKTVDVSRLAFDVIGSPTAPTMEPTNSGLQVVGDGSCPWPEIRLFSTGTAWISINGEQIDARGKKQRESLSQGLRGCGYFEASDAFLRWRRARRLTNTLAAAPPTLFGVLFSGPAAKHWRLELETAVRTGR